MHIAKTIDKYIPAISHQAAHCCTAYGLSHRDGPPNRCDVFVAKEWLNPVCFDSLPNISRLNKVYTSIWSSWKVVSLFICNWMFKFKVRICLLIHSYLLSNNTLFTVLLMIVLEVFQKKLWFSHILIGHVGHRKQSGVIMQCEVCMLTRIFCQIKVFFFVSIFYPYLKWCSLRVWPAVLSIVSCTQLPG